MDDDKIFKICIVTTVIGLMAILVLSPFVSPEKLSIEDIDNSKIDSQIEITASIDNIYITKSGTKIVTLDDGTSKINLVIFASTINVPDLHKGDKINLIAKVALYNGQCELLMEDSANLKIIYN